MRFSRISAALGVIAITSLCFAPVSAQRGQGQANRPPKPPQGNSGANRGGGKPASAPTKPPRSHSVTRIESHPQLAQRLTDLLPVTNPPMTLAMAADGFKNQGQFIAALHVSHNLADRGVTFLGLKDLMTGPDKLSLGQSIKKLSPQADADAAVSAAQHQADDDEKVIAN